MTTEARLHCTTRGACQTRALGRALGQVCARPVCIALSGTLGAGKTVLVKGLAAGLGMADDVTSPTFTFVAEHQSAARRLTHVDLYRVESAADLESIGWSDVVLEADVLAVEWAERAGDQLPPQRLDVQIDFGPDDERRVRLTAHGARARDILARLDLESVGAASPPPPRPRASSPGAPVVDPSDAP